jgi:uncharacterized protein YbjT (DUF2867 family)
MRALIAGATGFVGRRLGPALRSDGLEVRCLVRDSGSAPARRLAAEGFEVVEADLTQEADLRPAMEDVDVAYFLVHLIGRVADYSPLERRVAARFGAAAAANGVSQLVYLGGLGDEDGSIHLRSRRDVAMALRASGPPLTYFRAGMVVGAGSESYVLVRDIAERLPAIPAAAWMRTCTQPIGSRDVIAYLRRAPFVPESIGREVQIGGPRRLTPLELIDLMARALGRRPPRKMSIFGATPNAVSAGAGAVTTGDRAIASELTFGLASDTVVTDPSGAALFDVRPERLEISLQRAIEEDERLAEAAAA